MKNIIAFRLPVDFSTNAVELSQILQKNTFVPIGAVEIKSVGFVDPLYRDNGPVAETTEMVEGSEPVEIAIAETVERHFVRQCGDVLVFAFKVEKKSVPSSFIKQEIKVRAAKYEKEVGHAPGRKWSKDAKEQIATEMLPKCFPTSNEIQCYIDIKNHLMIVGSGSIKSAEEIASWFIKTFEKCVPRFMRPMIPPGAQMTSWIRSGDVPHGFTVDMDGKMKSHNGGVITFAKQNMTTAEVQNHISAEYEVIKLALTWNDQISFVASPDFSITKMKWLKSSEDVKAEDRESEFVAQMTLESSDIALLVTDMLVAFGGEQIETTK